ncbi:MAG: YgeY family selenium metabolism-linked hydrolase [Lachnospiraceae bacterium]
MDSMYEQKLIDFYKRGIQTRSYSDEEEGYAHLILKEMRELEFDEAYIDRTGNVVGRVGCGDKILHFDSHMDTVQVCDEDEWKAPPFAGETVDGMVYGRGAVDMKGGLSASVYAAAMAKRNRLLQGKTVFITGSVCEEHCDGVCLEHFYKDSGLCPDACIICEPSDNTITLGHTGKVQARIKTQGISAHGSAPEKGANAVYEMAEIISRVENLNKELQERTGGTIVLSDISCVAASLNAVPSECEIYLDRRLRPGESTAQVKKELDSLVKGKRAVWEYGTLYHTSWKGERMVYYPVHEPWEISVDHPLVLAGRQAYENVFSCQPARYDFWDFGTNAVVPVSMGIPTIGFGPGEYKLSHMCNERCAPEKVVDACRFYIELIKCI